MLRNLTGVPPGQGFVVSPSLTSKLVSQIQDFLRRSGQAHGCLSKGLLSKCRRTSYTSWNCGWGWGLTGPGLRQAPGVLSRTMRQYPEHSHGCCRSEPEPRCSLSDSIVTSCTALATGWLLRGWDKSNTYQAKRAGRAFALVFLTCAAALRVSQREELRLPQGPGVHC